MKHADTINKLTLEQKCVLLSGADVFKTRAIPSADIPSIWLSDGPHGLRKQAGESDHLGLNPSEPATCFPTAATVACSWNPELGEAIGEALGEEAIEQGVNVVLGPGLNMKRNPLCGRNFEYFSEDPYLAGKLAAAYIRGIQKKGIAACPKHFAVNNQETRRMASDSIVDERALREIYLTGFEIAVKEGNPQTIMTSYNLINGVYANENEHLLCDILKKDWGYEGAVVTDWGCSNDHALGVKMGSTLEMPAPGGDSVRELLKAVKQGKITEADVDARVEELLELIFTTNHTLQEARRLSKDKADEKAHHLLARRAAEESLVLLRNEEELLPLASGTGVGIIGDFAEKPRYQGAGSSMVNVRHADSLLECMKDAGLNLIGYAQGFDRLGAPDELRKAEAVELARKAEVVIVCLGLNEVQESEGLDRTDMKINTNQIETLHAVAQVNSNVVVVLHAGSSVETLWRKDCKAMLYACLGGEAGAQAVADALTGRVNPCGKLAETWPEHYEEVPAKDHFAGDRHGVEYRESVYIGYRYYQKAQVPVAYPFGYGLSYTKFTYEQLEIEKDRVSFQVTNTGDKAGAAIPQLYLSRPGKAVFSPVRELKGFARVYLESGESKKVSIELDDKAFRYWNVKTNQWEVESGEYTITIGSSCQQPELQGSLAVEGTHAPLPYDSRNMPHYESGQITQVTTEEFQELLGYEIPKDTIRINRNMTIGEINHGRSPIGWLAWRILTTLLNSSLKKGNPDLNLLFIYNMPLRGIAKMTNGMVSMGMVDGMVMELKGFWVIGIVKILIEFIRNMIQNKRLKNRI